MLDIVLGVLAAVAGAVLAAGLVFTTAFWAWGAAVERKDARENR